LGYICAKGVFRVVDLECLSAASWYSLLWTTSQPSWADPGLRPDPVAKR
jgi:hypothetical protein